MLKPALVFVVLGRPTGVFAAFTNLTVAVLSRFAPQCIFESSDPSCPALVGSCMDSVTTYNVDNYWSIRSCVAAATCYGVGNLFEAICCQSGICTKLTDQASLDYTNIYAPIVGSCAFAPGGCPITEQNFIDFYYGSISAIYSPLFPVSPDIVIALWSSIVSWTGFCGPNCSTGSVPYLNFNDWLHFSSSFAPPDSAGLPTQAPATGTNGQPVTFIPFDTNPVPPSGAKTETFIAPGTTLAIPVPTASATITFGKSTVIATTVITTIVQTVAGVPTTTTSSATSTITAAAVVTIAPGGQVIGSPPPQVSQPGAVSPTFNPNPLPPPGATRLTFTGNAGYLTIVPVPTSSSTTVVIGASFGGGSFILGTGGFILGSLPTGIVEVGGFYPAPIPGPDGGGGDENNPMQTSQPSGSSSTSAPSSSACTPITVFCDIDCYGDFGLSDALISDMDLNDDDNLNSPSRRRSRIEFLEKRASSRVINGCQRVASTNNAASGYEALSVPHTMFDFTAANGNSFQIVASAPARKPAGAITEHVFEFQVFTQFITAFSADPRNSALGGCTWLQTNFYTGAEALAVVNRIDSIPNIVFASNFINSAKLAVIGNQPGVGKTGLIKGFPGATSGASQPARKKLEQLIRGLGAFANYMNDNAAKYRSTAQDIITILQDFDRRTASAANPPVAIQFFEFLQGHVTNYPIRGQSFGESLAIRYNDEVIQNSFPCISINSAQMIIDFQQSYPFLNTPGLLPPRPLCFPDGSSGNIKFPQTGFTDGRNPTISGAVADGANMKFNMALAGGQFYIPSPLLAHGFSQPNCATTFELIPGPAPASPVFNLDCSTREVTFVNSGTIMGNCGALTRDDGLIVLLCGPSLSALESCIAMTGAGTNLVMVTPVWLPRPV